MENDETLLAINNFCQLFFLGGGGGLLPQISYKPSTEL